MANEKRLIDANALIAFIERNCCKGCKSYEGIKCRSCAHDDAMAMIEDAPTVDAVEVVHGRWLSNGICNHKPSRFRNPDKWTIYKCSECGYSNGRKFNANYCPNCGAKMDGGN